MVRSPSRIWWVGALFALTLAGCYEDGEDQIISDRDGALPPDAAGCTVGERRPCDVVDGCGGSQACLGDGTYGPCVAPDEICDGIDNDCDGATDEEFPDIGDTCAAGEGACRDEGTVVCTPDGSDTMCDAQAGDDTDEVCDGVDNDCDGTTDEEVGAGVACETNLPGVCSAGVSACTDGDTVCEPSTEPSDETCDGLDNDCDTNVDEGENGGALAESCYADGEGNAGPEGTEGVGACVAGVRMCSDGMFGACVDAVLPMAEVCDGIDNDCDGTVDNVAEGDCVCEPGTTEDCYDGPDGTDGVGVCQGGVRTCNETGTGYGECVGQRLPGVELCDGADNDCNGEIDDVSGVGEACMEGQGECMAEGQRVCDPETGLVVCDAQPELPGDEICDGLDNDCDGTVDDVEGAGENCEVGVGACLAGGVQVCDLKAGGLVCDAVEGDPVAEICDGVDNDCNGEVDDVDGVGEDCAVGVGACRSTGVTTCDPDGGGVICPATEQDQPSPIDYCDNGIDDDCDGEIDEDDCIIPCEVDDDCRGPGETCVDGACVFTACATDDDCAPEQQCVDEVCVDDEICDDDIDNDGDGDTDCADDECAEDPACFQESGCGIGQVVGFGTYQAMVAGESVIATAACASPTDTTGPEAVFIFTADAAGEVCVDTLGSMVDTILTVRGEPCEADGSVIGCNDDAGGDFETGSQVGFSAMAGSTYYFVADTFEGTEGMVTLTVTDGPCAPVPGVEICDNEDDDDDDGLVDCLDEDCAGDPICQDPTLCDEAMPLDLGRTAGMAMGPSRTSAASCTLPVNGADGPEMVYAFVPEDGGTYCIDTRGSMIDTVLTVRGEPCDDPAGEIACNDDFGMGFDASSEVEVELMDGATYYVIVDTFAGGGGDFFVNVREGSCGDDPVEICDDGFDNDGNGDVDCDDIACALDPACPILGDENCGDEVDNDGDGDVDCADADCALSPLCVEDCNNGVDDDADGDVDCDDLDCLLDPICLLGPDEICDNEQDDDDDGLTDCADADCVDDPFCQQDYACEDAIPVVFGSVEGTLDGESRTSLASCTFPPNDAAGPEAVYVFTPAADGEFCVDTDTVGLFAVDTILTVRVDPCNDPGSEVGCNDDADFILGSDSEVTVAGTAGTPYYIVVDSYEGDSGDFTLNVAPGNCDDPQPFEICDNDQDDDGDGDVDCDDADCALDPICLAPVEICDNNVDDDGDDAIDCADPDCVGDDNCPAVGACETPLIIDGPGVYIGDTTGQPSNQTETAEDCVTVAPGQALSPESVLMWMPEEAGDYCLLTTGSAFDTVLYVRADVCDDPAAEIACNDDNGVAGGTRSALDLSVEAGRAYYVFVDGFGQDPPRQGPYTLTVRPGPCVPPVEICDNGEDDDGDGDTDCADADCDGDPICVEICDDEIDNDLDGDTDCADADCADDPACLALDCDYDFEGGELDPVFETDGDAPWTIDGGVATSGDVGDNQQSNLRVSVSTPAGGTVSFRYRVSGEEPDGPDFNDFYDYLQFSVDGVRVGAWAGDVPFTDFEVELDPGDHVLEWSYIKDGSVSQREDRAQIDDLSITGAVGLCSPAEGDLRLVEGEDAQSGRLEVFHDGVWGTVCDDLWETGLPSTTSAQGFVNGDVACRQLGFVGAAGTYDAPPGVDPTWLDQVACVGDEGRLIDCPANDFGNEDCGHGEDIGLRCLTAGNCRIDAHCLDGQICVEGVCADGAREICDNGGDDDGDGDVDCADADCADDPICDEICDDEIDNDADGDTDCADADCDGDPACVEICDDEIDNDLDGDVDCADADCADDPACLALDCDYDFEGGELDPVFETDGDAPWTIDGGVATSGDVGDSQQSNLRVSVSTPAGGTVSFRYRVSSEEPDDPTDPYDYLEFLVDGVRVGVWAGDVPFTDFALELDPGDHVLEWRYIKDGSLSQREDRAQIDDLLITNTVGLCPPVEGDLRLVEGEDAQSGRLEVFHDGVWGTVCDDLWETGFPSTTAAQGFVNGDVACRQLGFVGAAGTYDAPPGVDPTWLDQVACVGDEGRLIDCPANDFGDEDCGHGEDIGLRCLTAGNCRIDAHCLDGQICVEGVCADGAREICDNGADDDGDGDTDCADADCADDPVCGPFTCENARPIGFETQTVFLRGDGNYEMASCTFPPNGADGPDAAFAFSHDELDAITICVDTLGSTVDTVLTAYFELCEANAEFACDDDSGVAGTSQIQLTVEPFINVPLIVDTFAGESGEATITVTRGPCEPIGPPEVCDDDVDNDDDGLIDCADAECAGDPSCNDPLACEGAPEIGFGTERGTLEGESAISEASCALPIDGASGPEAIYAFVPDAPGTVCVDTFGSAVDTILTVRADGCVGAGSELSCSDDADGFASEAEFDALAGSTYYIVVDSYGGDSGDFAVRVRPGSCDLPIPDELCIGGLDEDLDGLVDCDDPDCAGSVGCADPADLCSYDFEGGDFDPAFETDGDAPWTIEGGVATSGDIDDSQSSTLRLAVSTPTGGAVAFSYRVSSEAPGAFGTLYDYLEFRVDGVPVLQEAGEVDFTDFEVALLPGDHTLEWIYRKDINTTDGEDLAQIDDVVVSGAEGLCEGAPVEICNNGGDDDGDGDADCLDADCFADPACLPDLEVDCDDGIDNDGDGDTDCLDADCAADLACLPEVDCNDGIDNDGDGDTDCDDADCAADPICDVPASDGAVFFLVNNGEFTASELHVRDGDGDATFVGPITLDGQPASVEAIALTPDGTLYGFLVEKGTLVLEIDPVTAEGTLVNNNDGEPVIIDDIVFGAGAAPDGTVYLLMGFNQTIAPFDGLTVGAAVAGLPSFFQFGDIAFDPNGTCYLAGVDIAGEPTGLYTCDLDAGTFELLGDASQGFDDPAAAVGLAVGPGGDLCLGALYGSEVRGNDEYGVYDLAADPPLLTRVGDVGIDFAPPDFGDAAGWYTPPDDPACEIVVEICDNDIDDDGNGDTDCDDAACALDPACPPVAEICDNDIDDDRDGDTDCDDSDCAGDPACPAPLDGDLIITEVMPNPFGSDTGTEWFELYNGTAEAIDLTGWTLRDDGDNSEVLGPLVIESGAYAVLADGPNPGFAVDLIFTQTIANAADEIVLIDLDGDERAAVRYDSGAGWPFGNGFAMQFDARLDADTAAAADPANWCQAVQQYRVNAPGDFGTPGEPNDPCGPVEPEPMPISAPAESFDIDGSIDDGDGLWMLPTEDCADRGNGQVYAYDTYRVVNETGAPQRITVTGDWPDDYSGPAIIHAYTEPFDAADPLTGCITGSRNGTNGLVDYLPVVEIDPGEVLTLVISATTPVPDGGMMPIGNPPQPYFGAYTLTVTTVSLDPDPVDYCVLQFPRTIEAAPGDEVTVYGRVYEQGLTDRTGSGFDYDPYLSAQLGYIADGDDPSDPANWTWIDAEGNAGFNAPGDDPNIDEYQAVLTVPAPGDYWYAYRFSVDAEVSWQLCDVNGAGANPDAGDFLIDDAGLMLSEAAGPSACEQGCADAFACGFGAALGGSDEGDCVARCEAGEITEEQAQCVADALDPAAGPVGCNALALLACQ